MASSSNFSLQARATPGSPDLSEEGKATARQVAPAGQPGKEVSHENNVRGHPAGESPSGIMSHLRAKNPPVG
jgi:hypothetical protein